MKTVSEMKIWKTFLLIFVIVGICSCSDKSTNNQNELSNESFTTRDFFPSDLGNNWIYKNTYNEIWDWTIIDQMTIENTQVYLTSESQGFGINNNVLEWYLNIDEDEWCHMPIIDGNLEVGEIIEIPYIDQDGEEDIVRIERLENSTEDVLAGDFECVRFENSDFDMNDLYLSKDIGFVRLVDTGNEDENFQLTEFNLGSN